MLFNSYIFLFLFLPICLIGYYLINYFGKYRFALLFLLGMSLWFYGYFNPWYLLLIAGSILVNYGLYRLLIKNCGKKRTRWLLMLGVFWNLGTLGYFKYTDFFLDNLNQVFQTDFALRNIVLPLGISFFTFQQLSFIIDSYRGELSDTSYNLLEYATYVSFFPQLVAGPIVRHDVLIPQFREESRKRISWDKMKNGVTLFTLGLAKKVLLADVFGIAVTYAYQNVDSMNTTTAFLAMLSYTIQIYFDFSGYSDMAVGLGWMLNIDLPVNFDSPYKAKSVTEFWKRWHITLTDFFRRYVYYPLGGSRKSIGRTCFNILIVFILSGFWHGAGWTFILWGALHGLAQVLERLTTDIRKRLPRLFSWFLMFAFVNITWIFFRSESVKDALTIIGKLFSFQFGAIPDSMMIGSTQPEWKWLTHLPVSANTIHLFVMIFYFLLSLIIILAFPNAKKIAEKWSDKRVCPYMTACLLAFCVVSFTGVSTFLYFNF